MPISNKRSIESSDPKEKLESPVRDVDHILEISKSLNKDFCRDLRKKFAKDDRKYRGVIGSGSANPNIKECYDLTISDKEDYLKEDSVFYKALCEGLKKYYTHCETISKNILHLETLQDRYLMKDTGYQIQRYEPGGFYKWHHDFMCDPIYGSRQYTYIWYLNNIKDGSGYTEFACGKRVTPKTGKLVIFPSSWQYIHRAYPSKSKRKYICTGWIYLGSEIKSTGD